MIFLTRILCLTGSGCLLAFLMAASFAHAQQSPSAYTFAKRYNFNGQITGTISPDPDGSGPLPYPATRNTYNDRGLLTLVETGYLTAWKDETIKPSEWGSAFQVSQSQAYTYNSLGWKLTETTIAKDGTLQALTQYSYDEYGRIECKAVRMNPVAFASPPSNACILGAAGIFGPDRITRYTYDHRDRVLEERRAVGTPLEQAYATYTYDRNGQRTTVTDANRNTTKWDYDGFDRLEYWYFPSKTKGLGSHSSTDYEQYSYDANGNRLSLRKRDGKVIRYEYDNLNRMTRKLMPSGDRNVYYGYELRNLQTYSRFDSPTGPGITTTYTGFGEVKTETTNVSGSSFTTSHLYDKNGQRERITHPDGIYFTYHYDGLNRINQLRENGSSALIQHTYDIFARPQSLLTGVSVTNTSFAYDVLSRVNSINYQLAGTADDLMLNFGYSPAGQIVKHDISNTIYRYTGSGGKTGNYQINGLNQYTGIAGQTVKHDANGNMTSEGGVSYSYDNENRLTRVVSPSHTADLEYDPKGRLVKYTVQGVATHLVYDGDNLILEIKQGAVTHRYVHTGNMGTPAVSYTGNTVGAGNRQFLHNNHQGSVIAATDNSGNASYINTYDAYGVPGSNNQGRFAYTGQLYLAELGLYHYRARTYAPKLGRFLQTDPVGYEDQMNLYAYVGNDPVNMVDPTGEFGIVGALIGAGVEAVIQIGTTGKVSDWKAVGVAGAVGAITGGVGGRLATQALQGTISASRAVATTAAVGGAANGVGTVASNAIDGKATTATEAAVAVAGGAAGAGAGAKIANKVASKLDNLGKSSGLGQHIADATRASYGGGAVVEAGASAGETAGAVTAEAAANLAQKELNERR